MCNVKLTFLLIGFITTDVPEVHINLGYN